MTEGDPSERRVMRDALQRAATVLTDAPVRWALAGGYALYAFGASEPTHDIDIVVPSASAAVTAKRLADAGFDIEQPGEGWLFKAWWQYDSEPALIDVIHELSGEPVDDGLIGRAVIRRVLATSMPVLPPDVVFGAKLEVLDERNCDFAPLIAIARAVREHLDWPALRRRFHSQPFASALLDLLATLDIASAGPEPIAD